MSSQRWSQPLPHRVRHGWEAPSFLRKPSANGTGRSRSERKPRKESVEGGEPVAAEAAADPVIADAPQGE
jgi:hypothetical protein